MRMLSRTLAAVGAAGLAVAGLATVTPANAADTARTAPAADTIFQIKVTEVLTSYDDDYSGTPEVGASYEWTSNLRQDGRRVGKDSGTCTFKKIIGDADSPDSVKLRCDVTYRFFNRGTVRSLGTRTVDYDDFVDDSVDVKYPVVDGTKRYRDAGGTVRTNQVNDHKAQLTFRLTGVGNAN